MIARLCGSLGLALMLGACAVTMPSEFLGIATRMPVPSEDRAQIEAALASGLAATDGCPWSSPDTYARLTQVPCALLPASQLAGLAWIGNKPAALELGIRFEEGRGVPQDREKARKLYGMAAVTTGGTIYVWVPAAGNQPGHLMPVFTPEEPGLPAARKRLAALTPSESD